MPGLYTEADYENSVIELLRNDLVYEYAYLTVRYGDCRK